MNPEFPDISIIDTHCHLDMETYRDDLDQILLRADRNGVHHTITIGVDLASSRRAVQLAKDYSCISAAVGVHPHDVDNATEDTYRQLIELTERNRNHIVGFGEIGLDYVKKYSSAENQRHHFRHQLTLARELNLPVIIHDREAHTDTLDILQSTGLPEAGGVMHCFSGDIAFAREVIELGMFISIPGVVTFKNAQTMQDVAREVPLEHILIETDGPFLSPHPHRGKRNEPAYTLYIAQFIAALRNMSLNDFTQSVTANSCRLFQIPTPPKSVRCTQ